MNTINISNTCFFTGHRSIKSKSKQLLADRVHLLCTELITKHNVTDFIAGGALGFDTLAELTVLNLKKEYPHIRLHLFLPCTDQTLRWNTYDKKMWESIRLLADDYTFITKTTYVDGCMQLRNEAMVDTARFGIAYCKRKFGGTASTVEYARQKGRYINIISDI